jgi:uncharacterized membrane protein YvbJ
MEEKRFCAGCGHQLEEGAKFCTYCGRAVEGIGFNNSGNNTNDYTADHSCFFKGAAAGF